MTRRIYIQIAIAILLITIGFLAGNLRSGSGDSDSSGHVGHGVSEQVPETWTCSMHPQIQLPGPGKCPLCGMDLIPLEVDGGADEEGATLTMSPAAMGLAEIRTVPVRRGAARREVRMVGKVEYDETRVKSIAAWVSGRLDRLFVDYEGISIRQGDHLVWMYSPELVSAQEELLQALRAEQELRGSNVSLLRESASATIEAVRDKLRLLGLTDDQIAEVESRGTTEDHVTIYAPTDGVVTSKRANEGEYVETGRVIYQIADLSHLWVKLDAYESDLSWLRYGQDVTFTATAFPGQVFEGRISFIDPVLDPRTRTVKVRVNVDNSNGLLKPGLFVRATVRAELTAGGHVTTADLRGKWIGPMHPEIVSDVPGDCEICGMPLVRAEELGYEAYPESAESPLLIPVSAPLITGRRAVVYVRDPESERPRFSGREVVLGPRAEDHYVVASGLAEGELVVMNGAFKIDSAMQIQARPSMMSPEGGVAPPSHDHGSPRESVVETATVERFEPPAGFQGGLGEVYRRYLESADALARDNGAEAQAAGIKLLGALDGVDMEGLSEKAHSAWMRWSKQMRSSAARIGSASDLDAARSELPDLTMALADAIRAFGLSEGIDVLRFHCPMAFDGRGADWLQSAEATANPYYGAAMYRCGDAVEKLVEGENR